MLRQKTSDRRLRSDIASYNPARLALISNNRKRVVLKYVKCDVKEKGLFALSYAAWICPEILMYLFSTNLHPESIIGGKGGSVMVAKDEAAKRIWPLIAVRST